MNPTVNKSDFEDLTTNLKDLAYSYLEKYNPSKQQLKVYLLKKYLTKIKGTKSKKEVTFIIDEIITNLERNKIINDEMYSDSKARMFLRRGYSLNKINQSLRNKALDVFIEADRHNWIHQTNWLGEPSLQTPEDLITFQEIIFRTKPDFLLEVGVAWAGSLLFYATIMESIGHGQIIGIDIFIPDDLKDRIFSHSVSKRIKLIQSSSLLEDSYRKINNIIGENKL